MTGMTALSLILEQIDQSGRLSFFFGMAECILACPRVVNFKSIVFLNPYLEGLECLGMGLEVDGSALGVWCRWAPACSVRNGRVATLDGSRPLCQAFEFDSS